MSKGPYDFACPEKTVIIWHMINFDGKGLPGRILGRYYQDTPEGPSIDYRGLTEELRHHGIDDAGLRSLGVPEEIVVMTVKSHNFASISHNS